MYLNGIKHNVVAKLNTLTLNDGSDGQTDRWTDGLMDVKTVYPPQIKFVGGIKMQRQYEM